MLAASLVYAGLRFAAGMRMPMVRLGSQGPRCYGKNSSKEETGENAKDENAAGGAFQKRQLHHRKSSVGWRRYEAGFGTLK
jgi:hypothetical protein